MKNHNLFYLFLLSLLLLGFYGCTTTGIAKPDVPMSEQCVVAFPSGTVNYGDLPLSNYRDFGNTSYIIVPAGKNRIQISRNKRLSESASTSDRTDIWGTKTAEVTTTTYIPYREIWIYEYEFLPGKYYTISVTEAVVRYSENMIVSDDQVVITNNPVIRYNTLVSGNTVEHRNGNGIEIIENPKKSLGSVYTRFVLKGQDNVHIWDYDSQMLINGPGLVHGFQIISGKLNMFMGVEAGGTFGLAQPNTEDNSTGVTLGLSYYYGGTVEFNLRPISFGLGGGMANGTQLINRNPYSFPYAELDLWLYSKTRLNRGVFGLFGRYYFNDSEGFGNKVSMGLKVRSQ